MRGNGRWRKTSLWGKSRRVAKICSWPSLDQGLKGRPSRTKTDVGGGERTRPQHKKLSTCGDFCFQKRCLGEVRKRVYTIVRGEEKEAFGVRDHKKNLGWTKNVQVQFFKYTDF